MTQTYRLTDLGIDLLEHVFLPSGLPLVDKGDGKGRTTSILVRGSAGSGKTTWALALALAIARHHSGVVLHLTTEFSPAEVLFKAEVIGLARDQVHAWNSGTEFGTGSIYVESLGAARGEDELVGSSARKLAAIDRIYALLHPEDGSAVPPVRAVVLDALTLPDEPRRENSIRDELLQMIQGLEHDGISTVLVEEAGPGGPEWAAFVVDVVFELSFAVDAETGELGRRLVCRKSRYSMFEPGPHVRGQSADGRLTVWATTLKVVAGTTGCSVTPVCISFAVEFTDRWTVFRNGGLVLSPIGSGIPALTAIRSTPGVRELAVACGATSQLRLKGSSVWVPDSDGPYGLGWECIRYAIAQDANTCTLNSLELLIQRESWRHRLTQVLEAMAGSGLLVVVHGDGNALFPTVGPSAALVWETRCRSVRRKPTRLRRAERWLVVTPVLESTLTSGKEEVNWVLQQLWSCASPEAFKELGKEALTRLHDDPARRMVLSFLATATWPPPHGVVKMAADPVHARLALLDGNDWIACRHAMVGFESQEPDPGLVLTWKCICATVARNTAALEALEAELEREPLVFGSLTRGLAGLGRFDEADRIAAETGARYSAPSWLVERVQAELRAEVQGEAAVREARDRLGRLLDGDQLPLAQRAEVLNNLAVVENRLRNKDGAVQRHREALALNPGLPDALAEYDLIAGPEREVEE